MIQTKVILAAVAIGLIAGAFFIGMDYGAKRVENRQLQAVADATNEWTKEAEDVIEETNKIKVVYRDRIKVIRETADPSGCVDADVPDDILSKLQ